MFKKIAALILALLMVVSLSVVFASCGSEEETVESGAFGFDEEKELAPAGVDNTVAEDIPDAIKVVNPKFGYILIGDESEGYTEAHIIGAKTALEELGVPPENIIWKYNVPESEECYNTAKELVSAGCQIIFSNSYGHQDYMKQAATDFPSVTFVAMTGDTAASSGLDNFCNAFTGVYESRYIGGVVAGLKLAELIADNKLSDENYDENGNVKIGYVGAFNYAEVVSGYTAFYLGIKSVVSNVVMDVQYTNSWFDWDAEYTTAKALMDNGCVIIGQHADSTGAPTAIQEYYNAGKVVYSVGYNVDMLGVAPTACLTSAANDWSVYYKYAFKSVLTNNKVATNWAGGYAQKAVLCTALGESCAEGTEEKVNETIEALANGTLHVFDTSKFTIGGKTVTYAYASDTDGDWTADSNNAIGDGYFHESYVQAAPAFSLRIDGITELN